MARAERAGQGHADVDDPGSPAFGVLLIDKPAGPSSHDVVAWVRWALRERAVGHCGTLDPAATGLLVVCVGPATKLVEHLTGVDKRYLGRFVLGRATSTADADGELVEAAPVPADALDRAAAAVAGLAGALELAPPAYSAIKVDGQRAHALARAGEAPVLAPRPMVVHAAALAARGPDWVEADLQVSKGTYVRSLALELGRRLGLPAHLGGLRRLACGQLGVDHPLAVTGLIAEALPPRPPRPSRTPESPAPERSSGKPRWRIALGSEPPAAELGPVTGPGPDAPGPAPDPRTVAQAVLRARLLPPWTCLPFPVSVLAEPADVAAGERSRDAAAPLLARLAHGQRLSADPHTRARLGIPASSDSELCALVEPSEGRMLVVHVDPEAGRIAPVRTLRFDPAWSPRH